MSSLAPPPTTRRLTLSRERKYQFMQANTDRRVQGLRKKVPDIHKTLETIEFLRDRPVRCGPLSAGPSYAHRSPRADTHHFILSPSPNRLRRRSSSTRRYMRVRSSRRRTRSTSGSGYVVGAGVWRPHSH